MDFYNGNNILFCRNVQIQPNFLVIILYMHLYLYYANMNMSLCIYHQNFIIRKCLQT